MDKKLLDFIDKKINSVETVVTLGREKSANGSEYITVRHQGLDVYDFWIGPKKRDIKNTDYSETKECANAPPKHTGGRKAYVMLMLGELEKICKLKNVKNTEELIGSMVVLAKYIEWNTGRLVHKRTKEPIKYKDFMNIFHTKSNKRVNSLLSAMKDNGLLQYTDEGYIVSYGFMKKGKRKG